MVKKKKIGVFKKIVNWLKEYQFNIVFVSSSTLLLVIFLATSFLKFESLKGLTLLDFVSRNVVGSDSVFVNIISLLAFIALGILGGIFLSAMGFYLFEVISPYERIKQDVSYQFNMKYKKILDQIAKEKDPKKKKELEQQAFALRQEYESRISENLQKNDGTFSTDWREALLVTRKRLTYEEQRLLARNIANLRIGIVMASVGIIIPVYYILSGRAVDASENVGTFVASYWPFFTIVIIIEIVAIFFLRLYSLNERRLEKNKNEMTNIELRLTSGLMLCDKTDKKNLKSLADDLAKEERNFVLGKNESSAITDSDKLDIDRAVEIAIKAIKAGL